MKIKFPTGTTQENNQLLLPEGMLSIDLERKALRIHDGLTQGGFEAIGERAYIPPPPPVGQIQWTNPGTYEWIVPEGVYSVCAVALGPGNASTWSYAQNQLRTTGAGGALRYVNDIQVTPGDKITVQVGTGIGVATNKVTTLLGLTAGVYTVHSGPIGSVGFQGGRGMSATATAGTVTRYYYGGGAASFTGAGRGYAGTNDHTSIYTQSRVASGRNLQGSQFPDIKATANNQYQVDPGGGATLVQLNTGSGVFHTYRGGHGAARVIWGPGRAFPNINSADVLE